jgi:glycosidase
MGLIWFSFSSCSNELPINNTTIYGLATPIQLSDDTTRVLLSDYFQNSVAVDSFHTSDLIDCKIIGDTICLISKDTAQLNILSLYVGERCHTILVKKSKSSLVTLNFNTSNKYNQVQVKGEFNKWNKENSELNYDSVSNNWSIQLNVEPGKYAYKLVADNVEILDIANPNQISNGMGGVNNFIEIAGIDNNQLPTIQTKEYANDHLIISSKNTDNIYALWENSLLEVEQKDTNFYINIPDEASQVSRSHIRVFGYNQKASSNDLLIPLLNGKVVTSTSQLGPNDWHSSIMYFMMIDRFYDGDSANNSIVNDSLILPKAQYYGGDIKGIIQKIKNGYFQKLGVNTIWISPITQNPLDAWGQFENPNTKFSGYHGYWPVTSTSPDQRLGSGQDVREMLSVAHKNGLKVLLDYVANHVHEQHNVYKNHPDWVTPLYLPDGTMNTEKWDEYRLTTWFDTFLPTLNLENQKIADFMIDSAIFWIDKYDFDGFRHDATKHIPLNFWRSLNKKVKLISQKKGKYIYQIGETYGSHDLINSYINSGMLDAQFDFNLYDNALPVFALKSEDMRRLGDALMSSIANYGYHHLMGNITGNQDKPRFISYADGTLDFETPWMEYKRIGWTQDIQVQDTLAYKKLALFHAFNMTIPGIPIIYYGDEYGLPGAGDPDNRRMMQFENLKDREESLRQETKGLITTRLSNMALLYGDLQIIENTVNTLTYKRKYFDNIVTVKLDKRNWAYKIQVQ